MMMNNTTPDNFDLNLLERHRQRVIRMEVLLYPSELLALEGKLLDTLMQLDANNPANVEVAEGLCMMNAAVRRAIKGMDAANSKAGA